MVLAGARNDHIVWSIVATAFYDLWWHRVSNDLGPWFTDVKNKIKMTSFVREKLMLCVLSLNHAGHTFSQKNVSVLESFGSVRR